MATLNELIAELNASSDRILADINRANIAADNMNKTLDNQLGVQEVSGVAELLPTGRTIGEQRDADMYATGQLQYSDVLPQDYGYLGASAPFPEKGIMSQLGDTFQKYIGSGGIIGMIGSALPKRSALDSYMIDTYGGYGDMGLQDKYGYNIINAANNYMVPGSSSFRAAQMESLRGLDKDVANQFYLDNYGKTYDQVYEDARKKVDPFNQTIDVGSGADYYGGNESTGGGNEPTGGGSDIGSRVSESYETIGRGDYGLI